jgi:hypothetical protein
MSTKRTPITREQRPRITDEVVDLFRRARSIARIGEHEISERDGGRRREYLDLCVELDEALGRRPWMECVMDVTPADLELQWADSIHDMAGAVALRRALEALA